MDINKYKEIIQKFADERNWDKYHDPKNLVMALSGEVGELVEIFQWLTKEESKNIKDSDEIEDVKRELADIMIYLIRLADKLDVDLEEAVKDKLVINAEKYPIHLAKDNAIKYDRRNKIKPQ